MAESRASETVEEDEVSVPQKIDDDFFKTLQVKAKTIIKELREHEQYQLAREFIHFFSITEILFASLKDEQANVRVLVENQVDATGQIEQALEISKKDRNVIEKLREEVIEAWKLTDAVKLREVELSESYNEIRKKFEITQQGLAKFTNKIEGSENDPLGKHKVTVIEEFERQNEEIIELNKRLKVLRAYSDEVQKKLDSSLEANRDLHFQWDEATNESLSNKKKVNLLNMRIEELEENLDKSTESMNHYKNQSELRHKRLKERDRQLAEIVNELETSRADFSALSVAKGKLDEKFKTCSHEYNDMKNERNQMTNSLRLKEDDYKKLKLKSDQKQKKVDEFVRKLSVIEKIVSKNEETIRTQKNEIVTAEKERDSIRKTNDVMKRDNENLYKKIEHMRRELEKRDAFLNDLKTAKSEIEEQKLLLDQELKQSVEREKKSSQNVKNIYTKLELVESEKSFLEESIKELSDELHDKNESIEKIKLEMAAANTELVEVKHQHSSSVKQLKDLQTDFQKCHEKEADVKDRWMKCKSQVDDINDKLSSRIAEITNLQSKIKKLEKKNRELNRDIEQYQNVMKLTHEEVRIMGSENKLLKDENRENDARFVKMKNQMDKILLERDLIANQMLRRQDENELLEREVSVLKVSIERANGKYNERLEDIKMMTNEIKSLRSQSNVLKRGLENTTDMRHEVLQLHRKLNQERTKAKVLEQEMTTPLNVHRWRKINRFDKKRIDLTKKCQRLQRKVLLQAAKVMKSEEIIKKLTEKIAQLEKELSRRPNEAVYDKLRSTRCQLEANTKRMKAAIAISRATNGDMLSKEETIVQLQKELYDVKNQFYKKKNETTKLLGKIHDLEKNEELEEAKEKLNNLGESLVSKISGSETKEKQINFGNELKISSCIQLSRR